MCQGPEDNPGINQRALQELFSLVEGRSADWRYSIVVSVLEIYNETVCDLLARNRLERLEVKQGPEGVYVPGLTQIQVNTLEEVNEVPLYIMCMYSLSSSLPLSLSSTLPSLLPSLPFQNLSLICIAFIQACVQVCLIHVHVHTCTCTYYVCTASVQPDSLCSDSLVSLNLTF